MKDRTMRLFHPSRRRAVAVVALLALAACGGSPVPQDNYYRLPPAADVSVRPGGPLPGGVEVQPFRADGLLNDRAILFRQGPTRIEPYHYHLWWVQPSTILQQRMIDALRASHSFELVAAPEMHIARSYDVVGRIHRMEQAGSAVDVEIELTLRSARGGPPLLLKTYTENVPAADDSVNAAVNAFGVAIDRICASFIADLANVTPPPAG
jgi:ABC-type uncharacterized transport system auxiliary subunit